MMNMKKEKGRVGLCLAYKGQNYGMLLQAYATQEVIRKFGYDTEIIDYTRTDNKHIRFTPYLVWFWVNKLKADVIKKAKRPVVLDDTHQHNAVARKIAAEQFRQEKLHGIVACNGIEELERQATTYDSVLVGSDQQWLPDVAFSNFRTLRFVPNSINKISYATSFGVSEYPHYCKSSAANFLKRLNYISVREEQGKRIILEICDVPVEVVLDPTYLLTREEWLQLIPFEREISERYVLCYFLGEDEASKMRAREYADKHHLKLVTILSDESMSGIDISYADQIITGVQPGCFVNLIRNAECIFTDSFHGVAFSVINLKQFYVFYRTAAGSKGSRNSRIDNILAAWDISYRLISRDGSPQSFVAPDIDYNIVNVILQNRRNQSLAFLTTALEGKISHGN